MALIKRNTAYSLNDIVNTKYGTKLKCTTAGTTSTDPLILDGTSPITDGTVVWEVQEEGGTGQGLVDYEANKSYSVGDIVIYDDKIYRCITSHTSTSTFDDTKWEELSGTGIAVWQPNTAYEVQDVVIYDYVIYMCREAHTSTTNFEYNKWIIIGGNTYSTTEQRIGTWIDGKPLYQKTYTCDKLIPYGTWYDTDIAMPANIGRIVSSVVGDDDYAMNFLSIAQDFGTGKFIVFNTRNGNVNIKNFTITYTKTTD